MRSISWWLAGTLALVAMGCSGGGGNSPLVPPADNTQGAIPTANPALTASVTADLGGVTVDGDNSVSALGIYAIDLDTKSLSATSHLVQTRSGQKNSDLYLLSIGNFLTPSSFGITGVTSDATNINVTYTVTHPFSAPPTPTGTASAANRADLGISGMVLFATDVAAAAGNTFFDAGAAGKVVANTAMVTNADAYYTPAGLITAAPSAIANTFPYKQLVDETGLTGSRVGITNAGAATGNFGTDGWTLAELGAAAPFNKWTGYGVLHQGQSSTNTVSLSKTALAAATSFSLNTIIIAKYNDPRAGATPAAKKANRLPSATADPLTKMAYRMPHGALDVSKIKFDNATGVGFKTNQVSAATLNFHLDDFDARGTASTQTDLSLETDVTKVGIGENGLPDLAVCIPGVLGDATVINDWDPTTDVAPDDSAYAPGGDAAIDSGAPGDPLYYTKSVNKTVTTGQVDGTYTGMVRATDPEELIPTTGAPEIALDGTTLLPLAANKPHNITYQSFKVPLITPNTPPTATVTPPAANVASGNGVLSFQVTMADVDVPAQTKSIQFDWNNDADYLDTGEGLVAVTVTNQVFNSPIFYSNATATVAARTTPYQYTDGVIAAPLTGTSPWNLGANQAPVVSVPGAYTLAVAAIASGASFTINRPTAPTVTDPEGDAVNFTAIGVGTPSPNVTGTPGTTFPMTNGPWSNPPTTGNIVFTVYANDPLHLAATGTASGPTVTGTVVPPCPNLAYAGANLAGANGFFDYGWFTVNGASAGMGDVAGWPLTTVGPATFANAFAYQIAGGTAPNGNELVVTAYNAAALPPAPTGIFLLTNFGAGFARRTNQIEVGSDQRVFYSLMAATFPQTTSGITVTQNYDPTNGAQPNFFWFDYTSGTPVTTSNTVSTGTNKVMAMALDQNNDVYYIDQNHVLHHHIKASAYAEDTTAPYPLNLAPTIGTNAGVADANRKVADFIVDYRNKLFFILVVSQGPTAPGNTLLYRIECGGTYAPTVAGNPNPLRFNGSSNTTQTSYYDIFIDQLNTTGTVLGTQGEAQIMYCSFSDSLEYRSFNSNLVATGSGGALGANHTCAALTLGNWFAGSYANTNAFFVYRPGSAFPTGWMTNWQ